MNNQPRTARFVVAALVAAGFCAPALAQGETGFLRGRGRTDVVFSYLQDRYDEFYVGSKKVAMDEVGTIQREGFTLYAAHGVTDDVDVVLNAAYVESQANGTAGFPDESDLQDVALYTKWRIGAWPMGPGTFSFLLEPGVELPLADYEDDAVTAIGDGEARLRGRAIAHWQSKQGLFASLESGYDRRSGAPKDEVPLNLSVGVPLGRLTLTPFYSRVESLGGTDIGDPGGFPSNEEDFERVGVSAFWSFDSRVGLVASYRTTIDGRNTGDVDGFSIGLVARF